MIKSKYLVLTPIFVKFNETLTEIKYISFYFDARGLTPLNILDISRFNKLYIIKTAQIQTNPFINFVFLPNSIKILGIISFLQCQIKYINLSNCWKLKDLEKQAFRQNIMHSLDLSKCNYLNYIGYEAFTENKIKRIELPINVKYILFGAFSHNEIEYLDLSKYKNLREISVGTFGRNEIKHIKFPPNIELIRLNSFIFNQIEILDLTECKLLKEIEIHAFSNNPIREVKILDNVIYSDIEKVQDSNDNFDKFMIYYYKNNKKSGDYIYINGEWQWYPL